MAIVETYERGGLGVHVLLHGTLTYEDLRESFDRIWLAPESAAVRYHIMQAGRDLKLNIPASRYRDVGRLIPELEKIKPDMISAFIPGPRHDMIAMINMVMVFAQVWGSKAKFKIFTNIDEARAWIDRELPDLDPEPESKPER